MERSLFNQRTRFALFAYQVEHTRYKIRSCRNPKNQNHWYIVWVVITITGCKSSELHAGGSSFSYHTNRRYILSRYVECWMLAENREVNLVTNKRIYNNFLVTGQFIIRSHYTALCIFEFTSQKAKSKKSVFYHLPHTIYAILLQ